MAGAEDMIVTRQELVQVQSDIQELKELRGEGSEIKQMLQAMCPNLNRDSIGADATRRPTTLVRERHSSAPPLARNTGHFIADCPKRSGYKKGTDSGFHDSGKHESPSFTKGKPKTRFFKKALKDYRRENKKRDKAFFAEMEKSYSKRSTSSSSSSSSSDEEITIKKGKDKDDPAGLCFMAFGDKPKSRSHQRRRSRKSFCSMALGDREEKSSSDDSDDDDGKTLAYRRHEIEWIAAAHRPNASGVSDLDRLWQMRQLCWIVLYRSGEELMRWQEMFHHLWQILYCTYKTV
ncbi:hypothetical protein GUJ93_ZPchr0013g36231 [Zizania palustris]|uniref:Uncharacterized protein n=1 Tax=Zizania palustris TaxID=103762 RepID=A0A8J6BYM5_ZIZPA|nr:hypothetical protein GUJ93_ZPchr0013g36231 [Zizania palustris]